MLYLLSGVGEGSDSCSSSVGDGVQASRGCWESLGGSLLEVRWECVCRVGMCVGKGFL